MHVKRQNDRRIVVEHDLRTSQVVKISPQGAKEISKFCEVRVLFEGKEIIVEYHMRKLIMHNWIALIGYVSHNAR